MKITYDPEIGAIYIRLVEGTHQSMKLNYYPDTDSLYIQLSENTSTESVEIPEGIVLDYDAHGNLVGIDNASRKAKLEELVLKRLPSDFHAAA